MIIAVGNNEWHYPAVIKLCNNGHNLCIFSNFTEKTNGSKDYSKKSINMDVRKHSSCSF